MIKAVQMSDIHLGFQYNRLPAELAEIRRQELMQTFRNGLKFAQTQQVDFYCCLGIFLMDRSQNGALFRTFGMLWPTLPPSGNDCRWQPRLCISWFCLVREGQVAGECTFSRRIDHLIFLNYTPRFGAQLQCSVSVRYAASTSRRQAR